MNAEEREENVRLKYLARGPGDAATKAYIANKYLSSTNPNDDADKKNKKKKKKKIIKKGNLGIVDDEYMGWKPIQEDEQQKKRKKLLQEQEEIEPLMQSGLFRGKTDGWQTIQQGHEVNEDKEADDERPLFVNDMGVEEKEENIKKIMELQQQQEQEQEIERKKNLLGRKQGENKKEEERMSSGQRAGLLTSYELKQEAARAREAERQMIEQLQGDRSGRDAETIYRDETGRKIDPKIKRAEEARIKKEAIEKEERRMEWGKGLVQRSEIEAQQKQLEEEKHKPLARYIDDQDYNQGLREKQRWNDPAAEFLTNQNQSKGSFVRPRYKGAWKPNRYMIQPGYRWDGVDRSNGFEDKFLLRENQKKARAIEAHQWSTEDM
ncbi:Pre-mRNA-splicing factor of RES complex-domain-containing protein [Circinella umbellata]|nr:Pre-mRNA-splicing factor of RES complex-domain-containing protein [Circinella umbellata]